MFFRISSYNEKPIVEFHLFFQSLTSSPIPSAFPHKTREFEFQTSSVSEDKALEQEPKSL